MALTPPPAPRRNSAGGWDLRAIRAWQRHVGERVECVDRLETVRRVAGADVSFARESDELYAAVVVLDAATLDVLEVATVSGSVRFPYLPGYLALREAPAIIEAWRGLRSSPDLLLVDGHGIAHPRRFGVACYLGVMLDVPAIGVAKNRLVGQARVPAWTRGSRARLTHDGRCVGAVLRTRDAVSPVFVSVGHRVCLKTALEWVLKCGTGYRLPEPTRRAHLEVSARRAGRQRAP